MKKKISKRIKINHPDGKHSFLFWLILPLLLAWMSISYVSGFVKDKPLWASSKSEPANNKTIYYYQDYGSLSENLNQPFVTFWFDDAWLSQYTTAFPVLEKFKMPGVIAVPVNLVEKNGYMNWAQLRTLQKAGWEMTNHSIDHDCTMNEWSRDQVTREYTNSKFILWKNNLSSDIFVTPCGVDSNIMREEAHKNFIAYRTVDPGLNDPKNVNFYNLKVKNVDNDEVDLSTMKEWIDDAKKESAWLIIVFHKVGEKRTSAVNDEFNIDKNDLIKLVEYIKEQNVKVVVPHQILISQNQ